MPPRIAPQINTPATTRPETLWFAIAILQIAGDFAGNGGCLVNA
jgi:hypothetical protein